MGKYLRKVLAVTLVLMMVLSGSVFAFAEDTLLISPAPSKSLLMTWEELEAYEMPEAPAKKPAVMINGGYVAFTDAAPANINGRVMVPFRAILEAMGATVDYDTKTKEISAVLGDKEISFYAGKPDIEIVENGVESKITMDVIPFIDAYTQRTFVSTRFVAEAFGLSVGWDSAEKTVIIIDFQKMIPEIAEKFTVLGMLFDNSDFDMTKNYKSTGDMNFAVALSENAMQQITQDLTATKAEVSFDMDVAGVQKGMTADMTIDIETDIEDLYALLGADAPDKAYIEELLTGLDMAIKMDDENIYISMPVLDYLLQGETGVSAEEGQTVWYAIPFSLLYDTYEEMGVDFEGMLNGMMEMKGLEDFLNIMVDMSEDSMTIDTYFEVNAVVAVFEEIMGDDQFKKSGNTYTLSVDPEWLAEKLEAFGSETAEEYLGEWKTDGINFDFDLTVRATSSGKLSSYAMKGVMDLGFLIGHEGAEMTFEAEGSTFKADMEFIVDVPDLVKVTVSSTENATETSKSPDVKIPAGDKVIDLYDLILESEASTPVDTQAGAQ